MTAQVQSLEETRNLFGSNAAVASVGDQLSLKYQLPVSVPRMPVIPGDQL